MPLGKRAVQQSQMFIPMAELPQFPAHPSYSRLNRLLSSRRPGQALARPVSCRRAGPVRRLHPALHPTCAAPALPVLPTAHAPPPPYRSLLPSAGTSRGHRSRHLPTPVKRPPAFIRRARCRSPLARRHPKACQTLTEPASLALLRPNHQGTTPQTTSTTSHRLTDPSAPSPIVTSLGSVLPAG